MVDYADLRKDALWFVLIAASVVLLLYQSPLAPGRSGVPGTDSAVFAFTAERVLNGERLYETVWDHKGPYVYVLNGLGLLIGGLRGIWLVELLLMFASAALGYRTLRYFWERRVSGTAVVILLLGASLMLNGGNFSEEYALPFLFASFYLFVPFLQGIRLSLARTLALGIAFGIVVLLRPNMAAPFAVLAGAFALSNARASEWILLSKGFLAFMGGASLALVPVVAPFLLRGTVSEFYFALLGFNMEYVSVSLVDRVKGAFGVLQGANGVGLVSIAVPALLVGALRSDGRPGKPSLATWIVYALSLVATVLSNALSGKDPTHYSLVFLPILLLPLGYFVHAVDRHIVGLLRWQRVGVWATVLVSMVFFQIPSIAREYSPDYSRIESTQEVVEFVTDRTEATQRIAVFGNASQVYLLADRGSVSRYHFTDPIFRHALGSAPEMIDDYARDIRTNNPALWVFEPQSFDFLLENAENPHLTGIHTLLEGRYRLALSTSDLLVYELR